jgi:hypothetical protein
MQPIPVGAAEKIAKRYGYDQIIIVARKVDSDYGVVDGGEHVTTYGRNRAHCKVAATIGEFLKYRIMGWVKK